MPEHDCNHETDWAETKRILSEISKYFKENGEFSLPTKVKLLWTDRISRNRIAENFGTWAFRAFLIWLIWNKTPTP